MYAVYIILFHILTAQTCLEECLTCDKTDRCTSCKDGYYLHKPKRLCFPCTNEACLTCTDGIKCSSCKPGTFGITCENQCNLECKNNTCNYGDGTCSCIDGYYGPNCSEKCSESCSDACDQSGSCLCRPGYYGDTCRSKCYNGCLDCDNPFNCTLCSTNRHGIQCEKACSQNCSTGCNLYDGHCNNCYIGWFGIYCDNRCSVHCANECDSMGKCSGCVPGYYEDFCNIQCSSNCIGGCNQSTGVCLVCVTGFEGRFCEVIPDKKFSTQILSLSGVGIAGWAIASVLALVVVLGLVVFCRRRVKTAQEVNKKPEWTDDRYYNVKSMKDAVSVSIRPDSTPYCSCLDDTDISHTYSALDKNAA
ncbi:hypothetical protein DPMN_073039 [Dreissena polymorpha]|uniref:EGF-like domain-containing protein n=1 Tax=Dreissena polymorpha TaxID=45954 RepID=A0A9D4BYB4_DREPO|nr:hypothetical protein DPMN_073039 [Dreissena polymorpha]